MTFQRARSKEQIAQRRTALLDAAAALMQKQGYDAVSLNAVSTYAGITKASTYRYFESKEDIYLQLLMQDIAEWIGHLEQELAPYAEQGNAKPVAEILVDSTLQRPRLWNLLAVMSSILERNISFQKMAKYKTHIKEFWLRITNTVKVAIPTLAIERIQVLIQLHIFLVASGWHSAHPSQVISELYDMPEFTMWKRDTRQDLIDSLYFALKGMMAD